MGWITGLLVVLVFELMLVLFRLINIDRTLERLADVDLPSRRFGP